ncbi:uncharacterized protein LOC131025935 [Salvia miltiorrhiza]|uniref:uncharacterized protein LOC131025935 n=1 Tax=Salvia miltiorrhiza TaxID=226208 RepID=UPI0025AC5DFC|nr:uncharacterized protein LOC131025935 [Salvia miltiorrhiza]
METKLTAVDWQPILNATGFNNYVAFDCVCSDRGRSGGLCLIWMDDLKVTLKSSSEHHILETIEDDIHDAWDFCGIYGWSKTDEHVLMWNLMRDVLSDVNSKWICVGDFNETMYHFEKRGGNLKTDLRLELFRSTVESCNLIDLGFSGDPFTWSNNQRGADNIMERLDRIFGSSEWMSLYPGFEVTHLLRKASDHCHLLLSLETSSEKMQNRPKPFRFEAMWLRNESCKELCEKMWQSGLGSRSVSDLKQKIEDMGRELKIWEKEVFGNVRKKCAELRERLAILKKSNMEAWSKDEQRMIEDELDELLKQEELMWKQRSRADWINHGDRNTGFFHKVAEDRKKRNHIKEIRRNDGSLTRKNSEMDETLSSYFRGLFTSGSPHNPSEVLQSIEPVVTDEMNGELTRPFTQEEIVLALKHMHPLKAPGPDGMPLNTANSHGVFAFKLDLAKAYDRVEWNFLDSIMRHLGFAPLFVDLIMRCVTSVSFRVLGCFAKLRQIICSMVPVSVELHRGSATFSLHMTASSLVVGMKGRIKVELATLLGVIRSGQRGSYLGIPSSIGRSKSEIFQMLVDRMRKKSKDWKRRFLSGARKMVLIKAVLQSIPTYLMSCFAIPEQICQRLNSLAANFFWGQKHEERRIHWRSWKILCVAKGDGGLGFRDIGLFNQALLAKQAWRLLIHDDTLIARSLKARYYPQNDLLLAGIAHNPSYVWKSILLGRNLLAAGLAWKLGNGSRIRIGEDPWLPDGTGQFKVARVSEEHNLLRVKDLLNEETNSWDSQVWRRS